MDMIEDYEERKRLRRSRFRWRLFGVIAALTAAVVLWGQRSAVPAGPHIARYTVKGIIVDDPKRDELLKEIAEDDTIEAMILSIDSPGGTVVGSEVLYDSIREIAEKKPVVAVMRGVAASGGYMAAIAADHIIARGNTITGSVGVIAQMPNANVLMDKIGVTVVEVKSGSLKAQPSPFHPVDAEVLADKKAMIEESFDWFLGLVTQRRTLSPDAIDSLKSGRVYTGRQAEKIALIDALGGEDEAIAWLESEREIAKDRKILDYRGPQKGAFEAFTDLFGLKLGDPAQFSPGLFTIYR